MNLSRPGSLLRSGHVDTFCRDNLPPLSEWPELLFELDELRYPERLNCVAELLDNVVARLGADRPCLLTPDGPAWTYGRLLDTVNRVANVLSQQLDVIPGNRVLIRGPNSPWLAACWLATLKAGAVAVTTMPLLRPGELTVITEISRPRVVLCDARFIEGLQSADLHGARTVTFGSDAQDDLCSLAATADDHFDAVDTAADDVALLAFTSGTTGRPKATMHFHRDVLANADTFAKQIVGIRADDIVTGTPPLSFTFGLGGLLVFPLRVGAATLLLERATPQALAEAIEAHSVSICFTAPTAYRAMLSGGTAGKLRTLRRAVSAGEHLPATTWHAFYEATGVKLIDGIGSTEMLHVFISAADDDIRPGSTGRAVPGYRAAVLDEDGNPVPAGVPGRLAVKGPTGCRYLSDERQKTYVSRGWNITGDVFFQDEDGYFHYQARADDMIVSSGYNIAGPEVEEALGSHPAVLECAVVGLPDIARGQLVKAFVVVKNGFTAGDDLVAELQHHVKQTIAPYKYPRAIQFVEELPHTSTGKLQRFAVRTLAAGSGTEPA
ncbi:AMP-binding protein [Dactylosporangium sp. CA-092794]|uniref:AMP-binding protein n=1 Tax=Dactylosporangium sp. CA-092794 TaxID=3239929 RepID=UPI003D90D301